MTRQDFLKRSVLLAGGVFTGLGVSANEAIKPVEEETRLVRLHQLEEEAFIGWLAKLTARTLITSLVARKVSDWLGGCSCNGSACSQGTASSSAYYDPDGVYGYDGYNRRFLMQNIRDSRVRFINVSAPFLSQTNVHIMNVEGPFLAGLCWAAEDVTFSNSVQVARKLFVPRAEISNGGYRFDANPCAPTKYKTDTGTTQVDYAARSWGGTVKVTARDNYGKSMWSRNYDMEV